MTEERETLAKKLKWFRNEYHFNQDEFADECGISKEIVSLIERCKENVTLDTLHLLSARTGISVSNLISSTHSSYLLIPSNVTIDGVTKLFYGIGYVRDNELILWKEDISCNYEQMKKLVALCNFLHLDLCHLQDVIDDFLGFVSGL